MPTNYAGGAIGNFKLLQTSSIPGHFAAPDPAWMAQGLSIAPADASIVYALPHSLMPFEFISPSFLSFKSTDEPILASDDRIGTRIIAFSLCSLNQPANPTHKLPM